MFSENGIGDRIMAHDPRGSPSDDEYIHHLEFFNEQYRRRIEELEREKRMPRKTLARKVAAVFLFGYLWIPLRILKWSDDRDK